MKVLRYFLPAVIAALLMSTNGYASIWNSSSSSLSLSSDSSDCSSSSQSSSCSSWSSFTTCSCSDSSTSYSSCSSCESSSSVSCSSDSSTSSSSSSCPVSSSSSSSSSYPISVSSSSSDEPEQPTCRIRYNNLRDDLIGSFGIKSGCGKDFGVISFNAGGTLVTQDSIDLGQANPPAFTKGTQNSVGTGYWKKIRKHHYRFFYTKVVSVYKSKSTLFPNCPKFRIRVEGDLVLNRDNKCFDVCAKLTRWELCDLACNKLPYSCDEHDISHGPFHIKFEGKRVDFLE